jgi:hypothetical protein
LELLKEWLRLQGIHPRQWAGLGIKEWWSLLVASPSLHRKALTSLTLLYHFGSVNEHNAQVFHNKQSPIFVIVDKIKNEDRLWVLAGAKEVG